ncbi:MAG: hypothetical protein ACR2JC_17210 [Chloroflexota bacterium]
MLASIVLYLVLPDNLIFLKPRWTLPVLEALLLVPIVLTNASDRWRHASWKRPTFMVLVALASAANIISLALLVHYLPGAPAKEAKNLLVAAVEIWLTNVIVFGLWYWELDRGGPIARLGAEHPEPDFLFPQMSNPKSAPGNWNPSFLDYLYVSFTNATAFSPTDTMPLTEWSKLLMMAQSLASLLTIGLVGARAVNILK